MLRSTSSHMPATRCRSWRSKGTVKGDSLMCIMFLVESYLQEIGDVHGSEIVRR